MAIWIPKVKRSANLMGLAKTIIDCRMEESYGQLVVEMKYRPLKNLQTRSNGFT